MNPKIQLTPQQAFNIIDIACSRATFSLTTAEFFTFIEAMKVIKTVTDETEAQSKNS